MPHRRPAWDAAYREKQAETLSWFEMRPDVSLSLIRATGLHSDAAVVDVGAGSSPLLISLSGDGWTDLTAVDLSPAALAALKARLPVGSEVTGIVTDICDWKPDQKYDLWHDRAALHFLTSEKDRLDYVETLGRALTPGGFAVIGAFAPDGPDRCFGQEIRKYDAQALLDLLGPGFRLKQECRHTHVTPGGVAQRYFYALVQRAAYP